MFAPDALIASHAASLGSTRPDDLDAAMARVRRRDYGTIVVIGGGCYGSYYLRQLERARLAGAIRWQRVLVVDRDPDCAVARRQREGGPAPDAATVVVADWAQYLDGYLGRSATETTAGDDAIVPSPLMPHLIFEWLERRARSRWPSRAVARAPLDRAPDTPWQRAGTDGAHYVSFADWVCPINCIEPSLCPATRGPRGWSMPRAMRDYVRAERERGVSLAGPILLHCAHRAFGVGMFDTADVLAADAFIAREGSAASVSVLVGTVSHCHGALGRLTIGP